MSLKQIAYKRLFFILGCVVTFLFLLWSSLIWVSLVLLIVFDSLTVGIIARFIKKRIPNQRFQVLKYVYGVIAFAFVLTLIRTFVFDIYYVPSSSMEKTLYPGDYVLVNKISYGAKIPTYFVDVPVIGPLFTNTIPANNHDRFTSLKAFKDFQREDIIVFKSVEKKNNLLTHVTHRNVHKWLLCSFRC
jgi:signal peptidase I